MTSHTILLVEDNEDDVFLMKRALKRAGIENPVHVVEDGQQAIDYLAGTGGFSDRFRFPYPKIVFLDLQLPRKSGFDVLTWIRTRIDLPPPFVVVLTSSNAPNDINRIAELGALYTIKTPTNDLLSRLTSEFGFVWQRRVTSSAVGKVIG